MDTSVNSKKTKKVVVFGKNRQPIGEVEILDDGPTGEMVVKSPIDKDAICQLPSCGGALSRGSRIMIISCEQAQKYLGKGKSEPIPDRFEVKFKFYFGQ